jgi:hypothetical protein
MGRRLGRLGRRLGLASGVVVIDDLSAPIRGATPKGSTE